ncbi:MAG: (2Fe-2S)-binding protein [Betaproteobacteria bacterium]|nr:(2Fe-2S)-binding protein [Betaproteobacteria bacterium]
MGISINVNGATHSVDADGETPLLYILRNDLKLKGARFGCGIGSCGACTVVIDGKALQSCDISLAAVAGKGITTLEGIGSLEKMHALQSAFVAEQAAQCGYCTSGIIMTAYALLERNAHPSDAEICAALDGNICRCGTHARILRAIKKAAEAAP